MEASTSIPISRLFQARLAPLKRTHSPTPTITIRRTRAHRRRSRRRRRRRRQRTLTLPPPLRIQPTITTPRARPPTTRTARTIIIITRARVPSPRANRHRQPLNHAALPGPLPRIHAIVDREVPADHVGAGGSRVLRQLRRLVLDIGGVFPVVDADGAGPAMAGPIGLEGRFGPVAAVAKAWE